MAASRVFPDTRNFCRCPMTASPWKRPESVLVVAHTRGGLVLLLRRLAPPDHWQSVTGSLEWHESAPKVAARRELLEETGIDGGRLIDTGVVNRYPILPPWRARYAPEATENREYVFLLELAEPCPIRLCPEEHDAVVWLPRLAAAQQVFSYTNREAVLAFVPRQ